MSSPYPSSTPRAYPLRTSLWLPELARAGVQAMLARHPDRVTLLPDPSDERAHLVVFDPDAHAAEARRAHRVGIPLVALLVDPTSGSDSRARQLGASRVLPLSVGVEGLIRTLELVHRLGPDRGDAADRSRADGVLTRREAEVMSAICRGHSNLEIAHELYLSINSVKTYIRSTYRKIGVTRRSQAVIWGLDNGY